ncbi:hypothetical protein [Acidianus brierleyi]|uniref:Uncharacterized protein n=1 Tax=Acidianus brierleyi TaxID=41673 RepID=A0A2U9IG69_9CREN|nr:hypothetical protein [Acidianus brierleyi]AWR95023.1 hypothetical protein DFR85_10865 [Acidianus brierleyi]
MKWLKKRDVVIYYLLYKKFGYDEFNLGEAIDTLSPYFSKKVILTSIKYMSKRGLVTKLDNLNYRLISFEEFIFSISFEYLKRRSNLRHKIQL